MCQYTGDVRVCATNSVDQSQKLPPIKGKCCKLDLKLILLDTRKHIKNINILYDKHM